MDYNSISFIRKEGKGKEFTLTSGTQSNVFWDVEALYSIRTYEERIRILLPWLEEIKNIVPEAVIGIPKGGLMLAHDISNYLHLPLYTPKGWRWHENSIIVDDVMTTGHTITETIKDTGDVKAVAILINRSPFIKYGDIPIISGLFSDQIAYEKEVILSDRFNV